MSKKYILLLYTILCTLVKIHASAAPTPIQFESEGSAAPKASSVTTFCNYSNKECTLTISVGTSPFKSIKFLKPNEFWNIDTEKQSISIHATRFENTAPTLYENIIIAPSSVCAITQNGLHISKF